MTSVVTFRPSKDLNFKLRETTCVYLDHRQYLEGFELLTNIITSGNSADVDARHETFSPISEQLTLAATIAVHPKFTSRASSSEDILAANEALRFLRHVLHTIGPINARFADAFVCSSQNHGPDRKRNLLKIDSSDSEEDVTRLSSVFAHGKSLFSQVSDIWQIVGWAFNCSVKWSARWERWRLFLNFFLDLLEEDLNERKRMDEENGSNMYLQNCLALRSLQVADGRAGRRRFMRAIMADGEEKALREYGEVFKNETMERKTDHRDSKRVKLNIDEDKWGDYDMNEDEDSFLDTSPETEGPNNSVAKSYNLDAINLRARFFVLLAKVAQICPKEFTYLEDIFDLFSEFLRPLPIGLFKQLINNIHLPPDLQSAFLVNIALPFLVNLPKQIDILHIDQADLIKHFLPHYANSIHAIENAKFSFLLENILFSFHERGMLTFSSDLFVAARKGISVRREHAIAHGGRRSKGGLSEQSNGKDELSMSGDRILTYLDLAQRKSSLCRLGKSQPNIMTLTWNQTRRDLEIVSNVVYLVPHCLLFHRNLRRCFEIPYYAQVRQPTVQKDWKEKNHLIPITNPAKSLARELTGHDSDTYTIEKIPLEIDVVESKLSYSLRDNEYLSCETDRSGTEDNYIFTFEVRLSIVISVNLT